MKPSFALDLNHDAIRLLARQPDATWLVLGDVPLTSADLAGDLAALREQALDRVGQGFTTLLRLPDSQVLFYDAPIAATPNAVTADLDGRTPYAVPDLVFDFQDTGGQTHVAAVALETLAEAEGFATEHGFNPVGFIAAPDTATFPRIAWFGPTAAAQDLLGGATLDPETGGFTVVDRPEPAPAPEPAPQPDPTPEPTPEPAPNFATRQSGATDNARAAAERLGRITPRFGAPTPTADSPAAPKVTAPKPTPSKPSPAKPTPAKPTPAPPEAPKPTASNPTPTPPTPTPPTPPKTGAGLARGTLAAPKPAKSEPAAAPATPEPAPKPSRFALRKKPKPAPTSEAEDFTLPGVARDRSSAKLGLWLTLVLLVLLVLIGVWSLFFLPPETVSRWLGRDPQVTAPATDVAQAALPTAGADTEPSADFADLAPFPEATSEELAIEPDLPDLTDVMAEYAATGAWIAAPEAPVPVRLDSVDDVYVTHLDAPLSNTDAIALPPPAGLLGDTAPERVANPAPAGTTYALGADGLVAPTPEGALTPDGVRVFAGRPQIEVQPAPRPSDALADQAAEDLEQDAARAILARVQPTPRPEGFGDVIERSQLGGLTRSDLARVRPTPRPRSIQEEALAAAEAAEAAAAAASLAQQQTAEAPEEPEAAPSAPPAPEVSPFALAQSAKPRTRPRNFEQIVERTRARRETRQDDSGSTAVAASAVAPRTIPSRASVSRAATQTNVLSLNRVNLLGVFGKPSNPKALVRMRNGRTVRVGVGDRVDGGRVTAIGQGQLIYRKGSRDLTLTMPRL